MSGKKFLSLIRIRRDVYFEVNLRPSNVINYVTNAAIFICRIYTAGLSHINVFVYLLSYPVKMPTFADVINFTPLFIVP